MDAWARRPAGVHGSMQCGPRRSFRCTRSALVPTPGKRTLIDNIGADGKHTFGASRLAVPAFTSETTTIGGPAFSGPGSAYWDSDWNGSSGLPVPELWDDTGHDITALGAAVPNLPVTVSQPGGGDCLTPVVNVVEED